MLMLSMFCSVSYTIFCFKIITVKVVAFASLLREIMLSDLLVGIIGHISGSFKCTFALSSV